MMNLIEELKWRGLIQDIMPGTAEQLQKELTKGYVGFDPTSDSLHIGSLVPIILLMHLQKANHQPYALVGGATGLVGDPSGKSEERNMLPVETIRRNAEGIEKQLRKFLHFDTSKPNHAILVNNYDWFEGMTFLDFIRDVGKHITVNYMLSKDSVQKRLETGMSFTEFTYQLVQGYDFYYMYEKFGVKLQFGGSDQWGNIVTGTELIRRKSNGEGFAFTAPLLKKADGGKFGKTESGNIWLDASKTSPYQFYQFWLNVSDADVENYIKVFTFIAPEEIDDLIKVHKENPNLRTLQKRLAQELTVLVHSEDDYEFAKRASSFLFSEQAMDEIRNLSQAQFLNIMHGIPLHEISKLSIENGIDIVTLLAESGIMPSKGEARKMVQQGGIAINKNKINAIDAIITNTNVMHEKYIMVQRGKKNDYLIEVVS
jgi:tyrosyl-tRNA synthetase